MKSTFQDLALAKPESLDFQPLPKLTSIDQVYYPGVFEKLMKQIRKLDIFRSCLNNLADVKAEIQHQGTGVSGSGSTAGGHAEDTTSWAEVERMACVLGVEPGCTVEAEVQVESPVVATLVVHAMHTHP
ncbi:hypothetical protein VaNZ11_008985 [Volvox africanus]|uniref:Uncharacterized protein n=1 Tax=Volvox africanus TaxID=51714 RepID=A0ABQ5S7K6_9CHLO|nr:hypothetical protein VaNZ11_008985 [Volvox africanus]